MKGYFKELLDRPTMKKHLSLLSIGFVLGMLVLGFINFDEPQSVFQGILSGFLGVCVCYLIFFSNRPLNQWISWKKYTGFRLLFGAFLNTVSAYALIVLMVGLYKSLNGYPLFSEIMEFETHLKLIIVILCASLIYNIGYFAFYSYNQYARAQLNELKIERKQAELQLAALKAQLSPHFLFNCINSISSLFHTDIKKAEIFIRSMAKSYQYTLDNCRKSLIKVEGELKFVESYAFLLETRFGEGFKLEVDLNETQLESYMPPLTLQILVENAIKHNLVSASNPILISISGDNSSLRVSNNKEKKKAVASTHIGLKNIASRYQILSDSKIRVEDKERFIVTLPLLKNE